MSPPRKRPRKKARSSQPPQFYIGIGASAGGLEALEQLFQMVPRKTGAAYIVVQHLSPDFKSMMNELLARHTEIPISVAEEGMEVVADHIYLIPARKEMTIVGRALHLRDKDVSAGLSLPVDIFLTSLAASHGKRAVGIILSGTGSDGKQGAGAIQEAGGRVLVQAPGTAKFDGMPLAVIESERADLVLPPESMPQVLSRYMRDPDGFRASDFQVEPRETILGEENQLLDLLKKQFGTDFSHYKSATVERRIERRIGMCGFDSLEDYLAMIQEDPGELNRLYRDLLIGVTKFFRDREAFDYLAEAVLPELVERMSPTNEIRMWCAACASGEEAYSIAILFHEEARRQGKEVFLKIFATDLHQSSLEVASRGLYEAEALSDVPDNLIHDYFSESREGFQINPALRKNLVFTRHNVVTDPPFTKIDLITCRNLLIYFQPEIQHRVIATFHFSLTVQGTLFLGPSETLGDLGHAFNSIDHHWKIFRKKASVQLTPFERIPLRANSLTSRRDRPELPPIVTRKPEQRLLQAYDAIIDRHVPAGFLIDEQRQLVHCFSEAREYLRPRSGRYSSDILEMLGDDLRVAVATALQRSQREGTSIHFKGVSIQSDQDQSHLVNIWIEPLQDREWSYTLILLERQEQAPDQPPEEQSFSLDEVSQQRVRSLETELRYTKENLQATIEELETSNEEMQSTNEELVAANEELQSTIEELHSVNEELYTVNSEYQNKIEELTQLTHDMDNLLASTEIGTIFLDRDLKIRKFTPAIEAAFNLLPGDLGRSIEHFASTFDATDLLESIQQVLETGDGVEQEILTRTSRTFLLRIRPYRIDASTISGVVMTFVDIATLKSAQSELAERQTELEQFTAMVAHDLKAPLRKIRQFSEYVGEELQSNETEKAREDLEIVARNVDGMSALIDDLLQYAKMDSRESREELVDLNQVVQHVENTLGELIETHRARLIYEDLPRIQGDRTGITHLFYNLVSNAIKYGKEDVAPRINIECALVSTGLQVSVSDNGIGIVKANQNSIFEPFRRFDGSNKVEGTGFGLAICKKVVQRLGGEIWVESVKGVGSTFHFTIPLVEAPAEPVDSSSSKKDPPATEPDSTGPDRLAILHLDDCQIEAELIRRYLKKTGIQNLQYDYLDSPESFLEHLEKRTEEVDVLFLDYDLKQSLNGIDVLRSVRKSGFEGPAFLFSGIANSSVVEEFMSVGGSDVLNKAEVNSSAIQALLERFCQESG